MKDLLIFKTGYKDWFLLLLGCILLSCATIPEGNNAQDFSHSADRSITNSFALPVQKYTTQNVHSIQLYRHDSVENPPIIRLNTGDKLVLSFDEISESPSQYIATFNHYSKEWKESPLPLEFYLDGFYETYLNNSTKSLTQRPSYWHYEFEFPNNRLNFKVSGNYLLTIIKAETGDEIFSVPFFVTEAVGDINTRIEKVFVRRNTLREQDQPFSQYRYPPFVQLPRFDLSLVFVQNRFWGRARVAQLFDSSIPGSNEYYLPENNLFLGDYEFTILDIQNLSVDGQEIIELQNENIPPKILLRRDIQNLDPAPRISPVTRFGIPSDSRKARYTLTEFRFDGDLPSPSDRSIYVVGDFNQWIIRDENRMRFNMAENLWKGNAIIKQGIYSYKYVLVENNRVDDLSLDRSFTNRSQEYIGFVYFRDPARNYDRLLKTDIIRQN